MRSYAELKRRNINSYIIMNDQKKFVMINSVNRIAGTSSAFSVGVQIPTTEDYDRCVVTQASIPISYYLIPQGYNTFQLTEGVSTVTISIPVGNYNINSFCSIVQGLLTTYSPNRWTYTMTFPQPYSQTSTGLITYTVTGSTSNPSLVFNAKNFLHEQFGFNIGSTVTFNSGTLTSINVVNFINETTLFIHSDIVDNGNDDVLQDIYATNTQSLSTVVYQCPDLIGYSKKFKVARNQVFNFSLTDAHNAGINLNGQDMQITILLYKKSTFENIAVNFMKYMAQYDGSSSQ